MATPSINHHLTCEKAGRLLFLVWLVTTFGFLFALPSWADPPPAGGAGDGAGGDEDLPPPTSGELYISVDHASPYFRKGALGVLHRVTTLASESPEEPPAGGAGDAGADGDEGEPAPDERTSPPPGEPPPYVPPSDEESPEDLLISNLIPLPTPEPGGGEEPPGGAGDAGGEGVDEGGGDGGGGAGADGDAGGTPGADADKGYVTSQQVKELQDLANRPGATEDDVRAWATAKAQLTGRDPNDIMQEHYRDHAYENSRAVDADYAQRIAAAERAGNQDLANQLRKERADFRTRFNQVIRMGGSSVDLEWVSAERAKLTSPENAAPQPPPPYVPPPGEEPTEPPEDLLISNLIPLPTPDPGGTGTGGAGMDGGEGVDEGGTNLQAAFPNGRRLGDDTTRTIVSIINNIELPIPLSPSGGAGADGDEGADAGGSTPPTDEPKFHTGFDQLYTYHDTVTELIPPQIPPPVGGTTPTPGGEGGAGDAGGEGAEEGGGPAGEGPPLDTIQTIQIVDTTIPSITVPADRRPISTRASGEGGAGTDGGDGADEGGGEEGTEGGGTRTLADVLKEGPPEGVPDEAKYDSGDWVYTDENGVRHRYNGQGMLMSQVVPGQDGGGSTVIHYGPGSVSIQQETADRWNVTTHYEVRDGQLVPKSSMMTRSGETYRYTYDENGNITGIERLVNGLWRGQWDKEGNPTDGAGNPITPNYYNRLPDGRGAPPDPFQNNPQLRDLITKEIERAKTSPGSTNLAPLSPEGPGPFRPITVQPAGVQFNPPAPITIPNFSRDLQTDLFFGSGLDLLLPPTAGEAGVPEVGGGGAATLGGEGTNPLLDPQLDTGSALLDGAALASVGGGGAGQPGGQNLTALHNNLHTNQQAGLADFQANQTAAHTASHAQQGADLAAFQGGQNTTHDNFHPQQDADHTNFHNLFPGGPGFGTQHGQFHAQQGQVHGDLHAQQAADLNVFQAQQLAAENTLHTQQNADLTTFQGGQDVDHTNFHNANPGI